MAVGQGFEPREPLGSTVFKTAAFDHSASPPVLAMQRGRDYTDPAPLGATGDRIVFCLDLNEA